MLQSAIGLVFPHHCATCDTPVARHGGQCGPCWKDTPFIHGTVCDRCGAPLPAADDTAPACDDCLSLARPWDRGRAAVIYRDKARQVVLQIKHADRLDLIPAAATWLAASTATLVRGDSVLVPVPSHWTRLWKRRFNQAALLSRALSKLLHLPHAPQALQRIRATPMQENKSVAARFVDLQGSIAPHQRHGCTLARRHVLLIDDVMTSGATLAAATEAARAAGAATVDVAVLARVVKDA